VLRRFRSFLVGAVAVEPGIETADVADGLGHELVELLDAVVDVLDLAPHLRAFAVFNFLEQLWQRQVVAELAHLLFLRGDACVELARVELALFEQGELRDVTGERGFQELRELALCVRRSCPLLLQLAALRRGVLDQGGALLSVAARLVAGESELFGGALWRLAGELRRMSRDAGRDPFGERLLLDEERAETAPLLRQLVQLSKQHSELVEDGDRLPGAERVSQTELGGRRVPVRLPARERSLAFANFSFGVVCSFFELEHARRETPPLFCELLPLLQQRIASFEQLEKVVRRRAQHCAKGPRQLCQSPLARVELELELLKRTRS
jgi:hypothetical protein